jgi:hypothetical protein
MSPARDERTVLPKREEGMVDDLRLNLDESDMMQEEIANNNAEREPMVNATMKSAAMQVKDLF